MEKKWNDLNDYHNGGGDMDDFREALNHSQPIDEEMLSRVAGDMHTKETGNGTQKKGRYAKVIRCDEVTPMVVEWLWPGRIPRGSLTIAEGDPGIGKSMVILADLVARVTTGGALPGGGMIEKPGDVVLLAAEDGVADTIVPRLMAAGADRSRVHVLQGIVDGDREHVFSLVNDLEEVREVIDGTGACLVIIDPLNAYIGAGIDSHKDTSIRSVLTPLSSLAEETGAAVVCLRHWTKGSGGKALYKGLGSIGYTAAARSVIAFGRDPDNEEQYVMAVSKSNLGVKPPSLCYHIESKEIHVSDDAEMSVGSIVWLGESEHTADDLCRDLLHESGEKEIDKASVFLQEILTEGRKPVNEIKEQAESTGISWATLRRAKKKVGVKSTHDRKPGDSGSTYWCLS